ncbi:hypothetical protein [Legionella sp. W05-934-2]|jgi:hypothetical protein|uniref:hypothetical protein n=1 Tax=Legionella sp. W05-934-2 TaxID=1198649 RepID=UPI00346277A2
MYPSTPEDNWRYLKEKLSDLKLVSPSAVRSIFCIPQSNILDHLLLNNLKAFLALVDEKATDPTDKYTIMTGALCYFHYQKGGWQTMASGSGFANTIAPYVQGIETIREEALKQFFSFIKTNQSDISMRRDDTLIYLFSESLTDIENNIKQQLEEEKNPGVVSALWKLSPFS